MNIEKKSISNIGVYCVIGILLFLMAVLALGWKKDTVFSSRQLEKYPSEPLTEENPLSGSFIPQKEELNSISFIFNREEDAGFGTVTLELYDESGEKVAESTRQMKEFEYGYMEEFPLHCKLIASETYTYVITPHEYGNYPVTIDLATLSCGTGEFMTVGYADRQLDNAIPLTESSYHTGLGKRDLLPYLLLLFLTGIIGILVVEKPQKLSVPGKCTIYVLAVLAVSMLILMNDEGRRPLTYSGTEMEHEAGYEDYRGYLSVSEADGYTGILETTGTYMLNQGTYSIGLSYLTNTDSNTMEIYNDGSLIERFTLSAVNTYAEYPVALSKDMQRVEIRIYYSGTGTLKINQLELIPGTVFYTDQYFFLTLFLLLNLGGIIIYSRHRRKPFATNTLVDACVIAALGVFATLPFFNTNLVHADDICYHMLRIEGIKDGILDGQLPVVIMPEAMSGNGFLNSMYPYLFLYIPALLRICNVSLVLSYKFLIFLANIATAAVTYRCIKGVSRSRYASLIGAAFYVLLPYRYTNIYDRGALGELLAMTFLPFVIAGLYHLLKGQKEKWYYLVLGFGGVLQCHVLSFVLVCIFAVVCCVLFWRDLFREGRILALIKAAGVTVLLNLWFVVPFVWFYLFEDLGTSVLVLGGYTQFSVDPSDFAITLNQGQQYYLSFGIPVLCCFVFGLFYLLFQRNRNEEQKNRDCYLTFLYVTACVLAIMIMGYSASEKFMELPLFKAFFNFLQFPWRLFAPASILVIFAAAIWMEQSELLSRHNLRMTVFGVLIGINLLTGMVTQQKGEQYAYENYDDTYTVGHAAKVKGILSLPSTVLYPYEWRLNRVSDEELFTDIYPTDYENTQIVNYERKGTETTFDYIAQNEGATVIFPIMDYYGYQAYNEAGEKLDITRTHDYAMEITLVPDGKEHEIHIEYRMPMQFRISVIISAAGFMGIIVWNLIIRRRRDEKQ